MLFHILLKKRDMILMKIGEEYKLYSHDSCIATTHESPYKKLSKQNCDEIFEIFDVEKLACDECHIDISAYKIIQTLKSGHSKSELQLESKVDGFILGFNKAVALNKNKLFTVEDVRKAMSIGLSIGYGRQFEIENKSVEIDSYIQSLQQPKEIEVEIVTHVDLAATPTDSRHPDAYLGTDTGIPFLDENGCLILKKL
jgi:hypothetical protein